MGKVIEVKFYAQQNAEELYISTSGRKFYVRQPIQDTDRVLWTTASKWDGGYEADTPIKAGITIRVVSGAKRREKITHFEELMEANPETGTVSAEKKEFFLSEQLANGKKAIIKSHDLHTYDQWSRWLLNETTRYDYTGYPENWLHFGTDRLEQEQVDTLNIFGHNYPVIATNWKHSICDKTWTVYEIQDAKGNIVELCAYQYNK